MANVIDIVVPDGVEDAEVVEIMQTSGGRVAEDESLIAIETDKATAEVPAPAAGEITGLTVQIGDTVSSGDVIGKLATAASAASVPEEAATPAAPAVPVKSDTPAPAVGGGSEIDIVVPDGVEGAAVVEIIQTVSARVAEGESLIAIETDKATAEVPAPVAGEITGLTVQIGDTVSSGDVIGKLAPIGAEPAEVGPAVSSAEVGSLPDALAAPVAVDPAPVAAVTTSVAVPTNSQSMGASVHASPSLRQFARELGVELSRISQASGPKGRITFADVKALVKSVMNSPGTGGAARIPQIALPDFAKFGPTEEQALSKIKQITGQHLSAGWLNIPLVTHFEEADISDLEEFRKELNKRRGVEKGELPKTTPLAFIVKAVIKALQQYPQLNSSLSASGQSLILKKYYNIGIAVDTPRGLLVPVIPNADQLSLDEISARIKELGSKGRAGKLGPKDMEGGTFTISSLGSLGGTNFTPLVNPPESAILGVAKSAMKPVWNGSGFEPRLILPLSVSYDHRILDGGEVARFGTTLAGCLKDLRYILV